LSLVLAQFFQIEELLSPIQKLNLIPCTHYTHSNARNNVKVKKKGIAWRGFTSLSPYEIEMGENL
jgi:hypothetical protein